MSPRTLRRQLPQRGESYRKIVTAFWTESALDQLKSGAVSAKTVGLQAGFEDTNAFRRAFKCWTGKTIRQYGLEELGIKRQS